MSLSAFLKRTFSLGVLATAMWAQPSVLHATAALDAPAHVAASQFAHSGYHFRTLRLSSADGQRRYRVHIGVPQRSAPITGYATLYALDGNAALASLTPSVLDSLHQRTPLVLVLIGYDNDERIDANARAWDYTPALQSATMTQPLPDGMHPQRINGGAHDFAQLITQHIQPAVAALVPVDTQRSSLWGHSYGGLFVLHMLHTHAWAFSQYIAADPSLWYQRGLMLHRLHEALHAPEPAHWSGQRVWLHQSTLPSPRRDPSARDSRSSADVARIQALRSGVPAAATPALAHRLDSHPQLWARYQRFDDEHHGSLLARSFVLALELATQSGHEPSTASTSPKTAH